MIATEQAAADPWQTSLGEVDWSRTHAELARWNHVRLAPASPSDDWEVALHQELHMRRSEGLWIETLRGQVAARAATAPCDVEGFVGWFEALKQTGPGQGDPLFAWLAKDADLAAMTWFLTQEAAGEAGFEDLVALSQVKVPATAKLELARNYWDEMGRGNAGGMHGPMLERATAALNLRPAIETTVWPSLALANTLTALATTRRYAWHSIGALGVVELTAPSRVSQVAAGLKRLGLPPVVRKYFELHAVLDLKHSDDWIANVLRPLVAEDPSRARHLAEGALIRLACGARCFEAYRRHLWTRPGMAMAAE
ncbi:iron-containing redox enzyme family protein [Phenylobacterium sp.]|uniref:iron-containing redox enzyme family protein n=1 Tax=Phenylobacterium sp. TaxID=1871053 RepID=UPI0012078788|nr:iron-containing redox enzyme family protein [Phenylobacterium sp.]THD60075.1 MAG: iron-containing redox enzyme family protein [Phenylobacterium sp.]